MNIDSFRKQKEKKPQEILPRLATCLNPSFHLFKTFRSVPHYHDEIKFFHFGGLLSDTNKIADGYSLKNSVAGYSRDSEEIALLKFLGESIERFCLNVYRRKDFIHSSYKEIANNAIDIFKIVSLSPKQLRNPYLKKFNYNEDDKLFWTKGFSLITHRPYLIPAQLIYLSYKYHPEEKIIYLPISTGAAGGTSMLSAINRGIYEVIERDAFLITYLNKLSPPKINLRLLNNKDVNSWLELFERYKLEISVLDITTEMGIPSFLSVVIDRTGIGSAVSTGLKTHLNPIEAILGSIIESQHPRCWIRGIAEDEPGKFKKINAKRIKTIEERALYWFTLDRIKDIEFLTNQEPKILKKSYNNKERLSESEEFAEIIGKLSNSGMDAYFADISLPKFRDLGYYVVKVIIPQLTPFYLNEEIPYFGGTRLYKVPKLIGLKNTATKYKDINPVPHPFL